MNSVYVLSSHWFLSFYFIFFLKDLFIWLGQVIAAACGICGIVRLHHSKWTLSCSMWDLVPQPGIETGPPELGVGSLCHWTTGTVLGFLVYNRCCWKKLNARWWNGNVVLYIKKNGSVVTFLERSIKKWLSWVLDCTSCVLDSLGTFQYQGRNSVFQQRDYKKFSE